MTKRVWTRVVFAGDLELCPDCGEELYCPKCEVHYADCACPGPTQDDEYEYKFSADGVMWAKRLPDEAAQSAKQE
jgi:hypothetical protein